MTRKYAVLVVLTLIAGAQASGQEWASKMFETKSHDFGTVARGSKQEFEFKLKNIYKETVHISGVRSSCGCTSPKITKDTLKTYETGSILAVLNTRSFLGTKGATITVTIDQPYYAEVQLTVSTYIRSDVVFHPGEIDFGTVDAGQDAEAKISIAYAGRDDWQIVDVRSAFAHVEVRMNETQRGGGRVNYDMMVRLKPDAPAGFIHDQLTIVTNDAGTKRVTIPITGNVESPLTISPASLFLGNLQPGEKVTKRLVVRGKTAFRILDVACEAPGFSFGSLGEESKTLHFIPVEYTAGEASGDIAETIKIKTDMGDGLAAECTATATIAQ